MILDFMLGKLLTDSTKHTYPCPCCYYYYEHYFFSIFPSAV